MGGFFTGLKISLIRDVPFSGIFYPIYNFFKTYFSMILIGSGMDQANRTLNLTIVASLASFSANIMCCTLTHPLDLIRTRAYFQYHNKD